ncbi:MAG: EamA family transporter [Chloroflexi bacterium]|nr:EamA family transporter [Chloroflexota bacterium]
MTWAIFAILGALFDTTHYALVKRLLKGVNQYILGSGAFLSSFAVLFLVALVRGFPEIGIGFYYSVLASVMLNLMAAILYYRALEITDLSLSIPMVSFTPIFLFFTSFILLRELPTLLGASGMILIVIGSYILNSNRDHKHLLDPFREIFRNRGTFYMLIVAFLFSLSSNFDKLVVKNSDPIFGSSVVYLLIGLSFLIISSVKARIVKAIYKRNFHKFLVVGIAHALTGIATNIAFTMQIVPYVISLKRLSILFSVLLGTLVFKERSVLGRIAGASVMLAGVIFIILS